MSEHKSCPSHCCTLHGCKYGYDDCPVVLGTVEQENYCEFDQSLKDLQESQKWLDKQFEHWSKINDRKTKEVLAEHRAKIKAQRANQSEPTKVEEK